MSSLGLVTYKDSPNLTESDQLLVAPLRKEGFEARAVAWDDTHVDWSKFDHLVLRSCWNYHHHISEFLTWIDTLERLQVPVWNPIELMRWNTNKTYLKDLEQKGVLITPTVVIKKGTNTNLSDIAGSNHWKEIVMKPAVGASAYGVASATQENSQILQKQLDNLVKISDVLIQPLMKEVTEGEYSFMFFGETYSHTVLKTPKPGDFRSNYDFGGKEETVKPDSSLIDQAASVLKTIQLPFLYARVDGINRNGTFILMELELIEPHLFFDFDPLAPVRFAHQLKKLTTGE